MAQILQYFIITRSEIFLFFFAIAKCQHGVPKGGQKEKKLSGFGTYIFGIGIPRGLIL